MVTIDESDCCGNGCVNCVLNVKPKVSAKAAKIGKKNVISNYVKFKLLHKRQYMPKLDNVLDLHFICSEPESADYILDISAGHHVMMRAPLPEVAVTATTTNRLLRPYSPYWVDIFKKEFKILVNLSPAGFMSRYIAGLMEGDEVEFRGPIGSYEHVAAIGNAEKFVYIIAQGVAIAPTIPIVEEILNNEDDMSRIYHIVCFRDLQHMYFRERLQEFNDYWNYSSRTYLSRQCCDQEICRGAGSCSEDCEEFRKHLKYKEKVFPRRLDVDELHEICRGTNGVEKIFVICGTSDFQSFVKNAIKDMQRNVNFGNIFLL